MGLQWTIVVRFLVKTLDYAPNQRTQNVGYQLIPWNSHISSLGYRFNPSSSPDTIWAAALGLKQLHVDTVFVLHGRAFRLVTRIFKNNGHLLVGLPSLALDKRKWSTHSRWLPACQYVRYLGNVQILEVDRDSRNPAKPLLLSQGLSTYQISRCQFHRMNWVIEPHFYVSILRGFFFGLNFWYVQLFATLLSYRKFWYGHKTTQGQQYPI